jgi:hypothetical protein
VQLRLIKEVSWENKFNKDAGGGAGVGIVGVDARNWKQSVPVVSIGAMGKVEGE